MTVWELRGGAQVDDLIDDLIVGWVVSATVFNSSELFVLLEYEDRIRRSVLQLYCKVTTLQIIQCSDGSYLKVVNVVCCMHYLYILA